MFGTFRKHSTVLWSIIIAAMSVGLVVYFNPSSRGNRGGEGGTVDLGTIAGKTITKEALYDAAREAKLRYYYDISRGEWPDASAQRQGFDLDAEAYKWLFLVQKQEELGIHVSDELVANVAAKNLAAFSKGARGVTMDMFEKNVLAQGGVTISDYERFLRHELGLQQLMAAVGVTGKLVTPQEARAIYEHEHQDINAQVVFFEASNYLSTVVMTPAAVSGFYSNQVARYRLPERVQVSYVRFEATNYWAEAGIDMAAMTNQAGMTEMARKYGLPQAFTALPGLSTLLETEYHKRGTNYYAGMTAEQAKASIKDELQGQFALMTARKRAAEFADPILSQGTVKAEALVEQARKSGLRVEVTAPFDHASTPAGLDVSENFTKAAFSLRDDEPIAGPIASGESVYLIAQDKRIPSEIPAFDAVKAKVENDYRMLLAMQAARAAGAAFATNADDGLTAGKSFVALCSEAKAKAVMLPPFSLSTRSLPQVEDHISLQQFKQVAFGTPVGHPSPFIPTMEGGMIIHVQDKLPLDEKAVTANLPQFAAMLRQARESEAFQEWFAREAQRALADTPAFRPRPSEINPARSRK
jgi:hypothetical protein